MRAQHEVEENYPMHSHEMHVMGGTLSAAVAQVRRAMGDDLAGVDASAASVVFKALTDLIALVPSEHSLTTLLELLRGMDASDPRVRVGLIAAASMMEVAVLSRRPVETQHHHSENVCGSLLYSASLDTIPQHVDQEILPGSKAGLDAPGAVLIAHFKTGISIEVALTVVGDVGGRVWMMEGGAWPRETVDPADDRRQDLAGRIYPRIDATLKGQDISAITTQVVAAIQRLSRIGQG